MAPRNASKAQSKGVNTPLRRSRRGKQDDTADVQENIAPKSDELEGKLSTEAELITSPQKVLRQSARSHSKKVAAGAQQGLSAPEESVQADYNHGVDVATSFVSGAGERVEHDHILLERAL